MYASEFDFDLPDELIAQHPIEPRDHSRLMVVDRRRGCWEHRTFAELPELLDPRDVLVRNNTRVLPARLVGPAQATGGKWEGCFCASRPMEPGKCWRQPEAGPLPASRSWSARASTWCWKPEATAGSWIVRPCRDVEHQDEPTVALLERHGQTPCLLTSVADASRPVIVSPTKPFTPDSPDRSPPPPPGSTSPIRSSRGWTRGESPGST